MKLVLLLALVALAASYETISRTEFYHNQQVLTCTLPYETDQTQPLDGLVDKFGLDIWGSSQPGTIDIRVADEFQRKGVLAHFGANNCEVTVEDVEAAVQGWEQDIAAAEKNATGRGLLQTDWFSNYRSYADITNWYRNFATANPTLVTFNPSIGRSTEGRDMPAVVITAAPSTAPKIYMQCLIHAREWISGAVCNWVINQLVVDYNNNDATARSILSRVAIHLVPFTNPDGYEFSRTNSRLWRKNRSTPPAGSTCIGTDLNRNYNDNWGRGGSSTNPCTDTYMGRAPADQPETQHTSRYFSSIAPVIAAIDMHAYSQLLLRPYGWSATNSPDEARLAAVGAQMAAAIRTRSGRVYQNIKSIQLYVTTGSTGDWFYGSALF